MEEKTEMETHRLRNFYRFWRSSDRYEGVNASFLPNHPYSTEFANGLEDLGLCKTVEDFWQIYLSLPVIGEENATHYYLFKVLHGIGCDP